MIPSFQNYSLTGLSRHTDYIVTVAARNLEGLGPEATIQLRTEDGGIGNVILSLKFSSYGTKFGRCRDDQNISPFIFSTAPTARFGN